MSAGRSAENAELMLKANHIDIADAQEIRRPVVGTQVLLLEFKAILFGIVAAAFNIVNRHGKSFHHGRLSGYGGADVCCNRRNPALARQIIPDKCKFSNFRTRIQLVPITQISCMTIPQRCGSG